MIKLSNGVELSEETVISALETIIVALKKTRIEVNPPEPGHEFRPGDVAYFNGRETPSCWRFITDGLKSVSSDGFINGEGTQEYFHKNNYKYAGRMTDLIK